MTLTRRQIHVAAVHADGRRAQEPVSASLIQRPDLHQPDQRGDGKLQSHSTHQIDSRVLVYTARGDQDLHQHTRPYVADRQNGFERGECGRTHRPWVNPTTPRRRWPYGNAAATTIAGMRKHISPTTSRVA